MNCADGAGVQGLPQVQVFEPWDGPWKQSSDWGQRITLTDASYPKEENAVISLGNNHRIPGPPRSIGCTLFSTPVSDPPFNAGIRARVTYGSGGTSNTFDMDWTLGGSFALQANTLRIDMVSYRPQLNLGGGANSPYNATNSHGALESQVFGFTMGLAGVPPPHPPTFTVGGTFIGNAGLPLSVSTSARVPPYARKVFPILAFEGAGFAPINYADYEISMTGGVGELLHYTLTEDIVLSGLLIPAPCTTVLLKLVNGALVGPTRVIFLFQLGF